MTRNAHIGRLPYPPETLGHVRIEADAQTVAGSMATVRIVYTAGKFGIDDQGSLRFLLRFASDAGRPQFERPGAPNYCTATASNGTTLLVEYHPRGAFRPWFKTIRVNVMREALREGDTITLVLGDRSQGGAGWRTSTMREERFEVRVQVDPFGTVVYGDVAGAARLDLVPGERALLEGGAADGAHRRQPVRAAHPRRRRLRQPGAPPRRPPDAARRRAAGRPAGVGRRRGCDDRRSRLARHGARHRPRHPARRVRGDARRVEPARRRARRRHLHVVGRLSRPERGDDRHQQRPRVFRVRPRQRVLRLRRPPGQRLPDQRRVLGRAEPALPRVRRAAAASSRCPATSTRR